MRERSIFFGIERDGGIVCLVSYKTLYLIFSVNFLRKIPRRSTLQHQSKKDKHGSRHGRVKKERGLYVTFSESSLQYLLFNYQILLK